MFTGIIEGLGTISAIQPSTDGARITLSSDFALDGTKIGDSIAVNGACLTAVKIDGRRFDVDVSPETLEKTTIGAANIGERVNLERALRFSGRLDGHLVSGHVDGIAHLESRKRHANAIILRFRIPPHLADYMIDKGSVAVDGTSLTINDCDANSFEVSIIPHTAMLTTISTRKPGEAVNIETDMIGKYVKKFLSVSDKNDPGEKSGIDLTFLDKTGFL